MTDDLTEWVLEAAGEGYLTDAQIMAVLQSITHSTDTRAPQEIGIAELMQVIELARTGGLDDADYAYRNTLSHKQAHEAYRSA